MGFVGTRDTCQQRHCVTLLVLLIEATLKNNEVSDIASQADASSDKHDFPVDVFRRSDQSFDGLGKKPDEERPNNQYCG